MRELLPLIGSHPGGRSALTCRYRCGDACFQETPNTSDNEYAGDIIAGALSRRSMMRAAAVVTVAAAGTAALGGPAAPRADAAPLAGRPGGRPKPTPSGARGLRFAAVAPNKDDKVTIPEGYGQNVVIRWGEPILRGAPAFDPDKQSAKAQAKQFGYNNDFLSLLPLKGERGRQVLVANHEYTDEILMFRGYDPANPTREQVEIAWAAHGLSVVVVQEENRTGRLTPVNRHPLNRRLTATSEFRVTGPAAGSPLLRTSADRTGSRVLGTLNNCAGAPLRGAPRCTARRTSTSTSPTAPATPTSATASARPGRSASGSGSTSASTWRRSPTRRTASAGSSNSTLTTPTPRRASGPRSAASSTRRRSPG